MSLIEVLVGSGVFVLSATCSLQVWSGTASWSQRATQQRQEMQQLEAQLLAVQAQLQQGAGTPLAPDCAEALQLVLGQLGATPGLATASEGGLLVQVQGTGGGSRHRWFDPAAYGLCGAGTAPVVVEAAGVELDADADADAEAAMDPVPLASDGGIAEADGALTGTAGPGAGAAPNLGGTGPDPIPEPG